MASRVRALIDSLKRRRSSQRATDAAKLKRRQDERNRGGRGSGDRVGGGFKGGF